MTGKVKLVSAGGGSVSLATPSTGSNRTVTLPDADLTIPATNSSGTLTTQGDTLYRDGSGIQRLAKGTASQVLTMNSGATAPEWAAAAAGGKLLQIVSATDAHKTVNSSTAVDIYDSNVAITLASTSNKVLCLHVTAYAHQSAASAQNIESTYIMKRTTSGDTVANLNTGKLRVGSATDINSSIVLLAVDTTFSNLANNYNVTIAYGDGDEAANAYNNTIVLLEIEA